VTQHILHVEDEGKDESGYVTIYLKRAYCECGWLGGQVSNESFGRPTSSQLCRDQFYEHLMSLPSNYKRRI
jgi:hypothetical protein